jgi:hypothetical protein
VITANALLRQSQYVADLFLPQANGGGRALGRYVPFSIMLGCFLSAAISARLTLAGHREVGLGRGGSRLTATPKGLVAKTGHRKSKAVSISASSARSRLAARR